MNTRQPGAGLLFGVIGGALVWLALFFVWAMALGHAWGLQ